MSVHLRFAGGCTSTGGFTFSLGALRYAPDSISDCLAVGFFGKDSRNFFFNVRLSITHLRGYTDVLSPLCLVAHQEVGESSIRICCWTTKLNRYLPS